MQHRTVDLNPTHHKLYVNFDKKWDLAESYGDGDTAHSVEVPLDEGLNGGDAALDVHLAHHILQLLQLLHLHTGGGEERGDDEWVVPGCLIR